MLIAPVLFFLPLAVDPLLTGVSNAIINAYLARAPRPEALIAGYGVAKNLLFMLFSSLMMVRQTVTTFADGRDSLAVLKRFFAVVVLVNTVIVAGVAFTPLADLVFGTLMGVRADALVHAKRVLRIFALFPLAVGFRHYWQGVALRGHRSGIIAGAMAVRTTLLGVLVYVVLVPLTSTSAGAAWLFLGSVSVEGVVVVAFVLAGGIALLRRTDGEPVPAARQILRFFLPLAVTALIRTAALPIVNAGLARMSNPDLALAGFTVGWEIGYIFFAPLMFFHHVPLEFLRRRDGASTRRLAATAALFAGVSSLFLALLGFTAVGTWALSRLVGVEGELLESARSVLRALVLLPPLYATREYFWGMLMHDRNTRPIWVSKSLSLVGLVGAVVLFTSLFSGHAAAGVAALLVSESIEVVLLAVNARKRYRNGQRSTDSGMGARADAP
ncbi:MAG: hypothetical protein ACOC2D_14700 [Spirochaetota bacterium]